MRILFGQVPNKPLSTRKTTCSSKYKTLRKTKYMYTRKRKIPDDIKSYQSTSLINCTGAIKPCSWAKWPFDDRLLLLPPLPEDVDDDDDDEEDGPDPLFILPIPSGVDGLVGLSASGWPKNNQLPHNIELLLKGYRLSQLTRWIFKKRRILLYINVEVIKN